MCFIYFIPYLYTDIEILEVEVQEYQCIRRMKIINGVLGICKDVKTGSSYTLINLQEYLMTMIISQ